MSPDPLVSLRCSTIVFLSPDRPAETPVCVEAGLEPEFVALDRLGELSMRPPLAGHIRGLSGRRHPATAPYLGNLWCPPAGESNGG